MKRELKVPVAVISIGKMDVNNQRLFAVSNESGKCVLPLFTDFELAEKYRSHHTKNVLDNILPISIMGGDDDSMVSEQLVLYVIESQSQLRDVLDAAFIVARLVYVAVNPVPDEIMLCYEYDELITD